jgi:hypothetical protein
MLVCVSGVRKVSCHVNVCSRCQESELSCQCVLEVSGKLAVMHTNMTAHIPDTSNTH